MERKKLAGPKKGRGRPPLEIPPQQFEEMLKIQCTEAEICAVYQCTHMSLNNWVRRTYGEKESFSSIAAQFRTMGKMSLRRAGYYMAQTNPRVHVFYAKNYLGMTEEPTPQDTGEDKNDLEAAIKAGLKSLKNVDVSSLADIPEGDEDDL